MILKIVYLIIFSILLFIAINKFSLKKILYNPFKKHWHFQIIATLFSLIGFYAIFRFLNASLNRTLLFWILFVSYIVLVFLVDHEGHFTKAFLKLEFKTLVVYFLLLIFIINVRTLAFPKHGNIYDIYDSIDSLTFFSDSDIGIRGYEMDFDFLTKRNTSIKDKNLIKELKKTIEEMPLIEIASYSEIENLDFGLYIKSGNDRLFIYKNHYMYLIEDDKKMSEKIYCRIDDDYDIISKIQTIVEKNYLNSKK
ncbi:MAG: hypothetical protein N4A40_08830 [Tissierellales bacterium]|jgi:hypothetical protein|nr:hypothetical protein [Tissierellales bacterium]